MIQEIARLKFDCYGESKEAVFNGVRSENGENMQPCELLKFLNEQILILIEEEEEHKKQRGWKKQIAYTKDVNNVDELQEAISDLEERRFRGTYL